VWLKRNSLFWEEEESENMEFCDRCVCAVPPVFGMNFREDNQPTKIYVLDSNQNNLEINDPDTPDVV
jgi:hypothetical protein